MTHTAYIHTEAGESSLRCTCGQWRGRHLADVQGHSDHIKSATERTHP